MGDSAMEEGRWKPFKPGEKVTGGVWEGSLFGDSSIRTEGEDGVGVDAGTADGLVLSSSQRRFLHTVLVALGLVHTLHTPQLSFLRHPSHSRHRFLLVLFVFLSAPDKLDEEKGIGAPFNVGRPVPAVKQLIEVGVSVTRLGVSGSLSASGAGPFTAGVSGDWLSRRPAGDSNCCTGLLVWTCVVLCTACKLVVLPLATGFQTESWCADCSEDKCGGVPCPPNEGQAFGMMPGRAIAFLPFILLADRCFCVLVVEKHINLLSW